MRPLRRSLDVALPLALAVTISCSKENEVGLGERQFDDVLNLGIDCTTEKPSFCGAGLCVAGVCREACGSDAECRGSICLTLEKGAFGGCRLPAESICSDDAGCEAFGLACGLDQGCRIECTAEGGCPRNDQICIEGACYGGLEGEGKSWLECPSGQARCLQNGDLEVCNEGGLGWVLVAECGEPAGCDLEGRACHAATCDPSSNGCTAGVMRYCSPGGAVRLPEQDCGSQALCEAGLATGVCADPACTEADDRCAGAVMKLCKVDHTGFEADQACASPAACTAGLAERRCAGAVCDPGEVFCTGAELRRCQSNGVSSDLLDTCETAELCRQTTGSTCSQASCSSGDVRCAGTRVYTCDSSIGQLVLVDDCAQRGEYCDPVAGACAAPEIRASVSVPVPGAPGETYGIDVLEVSSYQYAQFVTTRGTPTYTDVGGMVAITYRDTKTFGQPAFCTWNDAYVSGYLRADETLGTDAATAKLTTAIVDWCDATAYCEWTGKRLCGAIGGGATAFADYGDPTKDQWTNACTSGLAGAVPRHVYSYGNVYVDGTCENEPTFGSALGTFAACQSPVAAYAGVFGLSGGTPEWTDSCDGTTGQSDSCRVRGSSYDDLGIPFSERSRCIGNDGGEAKPRSELLAFRCCQAEP